MPIHFYISRLQIASEQSVLFFVPVSMSPSLRQSAASSPQLLAKATVFACCLCCLHIDEVFFYVTLYRSLASYSYKNIPEMHLFIAKARC
jgi:hypothetical protein